MSNDKSSDSARLAAAATAANQTTITAARKTPDEREKDTRSTAQIKADVERTRAELAATLDAIEYRINVPKRVSSRIRALREENPALLAAIAVAAVAVTGVLVFAGIRSIRRG